MGDYKNGLKHGKWIFTNSEGAKFKYYYKMGVLNKLKRPLPLPAIPNYILKDGVVVTVPSR